LRERRADCLSVFCEFLTVLKTLTEWRFPEGQGAGVPFFCLLFLGIQKE